MFAGVAFGRKSVTRRPLDRRAEPGGGGGAAKGVYSVGAVALTGRWKKRRCFGGEAIGGGLAAPPSLLRRGPFWVVPEGPGDASPVRQCERCGQRGPQLGSNSIQPQRPGFRSARRASWFFGANERNFAPRTTTTRPKTRQQLP